MESTSLIKPTMVVTSTEKEVPISSSDAKPIDDADDVEDEDEDEDDSPEESSWTFYMQDFECGGDGHGDNIIINSSFCSSGLIFHDNNNDDDSNSSSLVSDAASSAGKKFAGINNKAAAVTSNTFALESRNNNNNYYYNYNAGKLSFRSPAGFNNHDRDLEDTASSPGNTPKVHTNSGHNQDDIDSSELKKKGLCLVPVSVLAKYFASAY